MYVALINIRITNTTSKTVTIYEKMVRSKYKMQKSLNITKGCFTYGNKIHIIILGKKLIVTDRVRIVKIEQVLPRMFYKISSSS